MAQAAELVEVWRGDLLESVHSGHAVVMHASGDILHQWGDPQALVYPRSSAKMIQALPLIESGAANAFDLSSGQLALACASHQGAAIHTDRVQGWISDLGLTDEAFRCGPQNPGDRAARHALIRDGQSPCRYHNNCSGKHAGFLTLARHLGGGPDYTDIDHPVQVAVKTAFEEVTDEGSPLWALDGCSAPNHATRLTAMARAMADFSSAGQRSGLRADAQRRLTQVMMAHAPLVNGHGKACTELMRATTESVAVKGGAEGFYVAILPERQIGIALKIADGAERASEVAIAAILAKLGVLDPASPWVSRPVTNWDGLATGQIRPAPGLLQ